MIACSDGCESLFTSVHCCPEMSWVLVVGGNEDGKVAEDDDGINSQIFVPSLFEIKISERMLHGIVEEDAKSELKLLL